MHTINYQGHCGFTIPSLISVYCWEFESEIFLTLQEKLEGIVEPLQAKLKANSMKRDRKNGLLHSQTDLSPHEEKFGNIDLIATDQLIVGALESAFVAMVCVL